MSQDSSNAELFEMISEIQIEDGVCFDPDNLTLHGLYSDELSAHRAKRVWVETLSTNFFLEQDLDYSITVATDSERGKYILTCSFNSASARYAFWKITHSQAPEAQYIIETAHVPDSEANQEKFLRSKDLHSTKNTIESKLDEIDMAVFGETTTILDKLVEKLKSFVKKPT